MTRETGRGRLSPRLIVAACILAGLGLIPLGIYTYLKSSEASRWEEMRLQIQTMAREAESADPRRPVLRGVPVPGNAWTDYGSALQLTDPYIQLFPAVEYLEQKPNASRDAALAVVKRHFQAIEIFRRGASRETSQFPRAWQEGQKTNPPPDPLVCLVACHARFLAERGQYVEAAEVLLDIGQFSEDAVHNGAFIDLVIGSGLMGLAFREFKDLLSPGKLTQDELRSVERQLGILDEGTTTWSRNYRNDPLTMGAGLARAESIQAYFDKFGMLNLQLDNRRFGFSDRLMIVDAFKQEVFFSRRLAEAFPMTWMEADRIHAEVEAERRNSANPILRAFYSLTPMTTRIPRDFVRECRAQLRLLRMSAHYRATGDLLPLEDPFGGTLRTRKSDKGFTLWSIGPDGVDDGGDGVWKPGKGKDIVLEVER